jgi:hypothetical protein
VEEYLEAQDQVWEKWRQKARARPGSVVARLRSLKKTELSEVP